MRRPHLKKTGKTVKIADITALRDSLAALHIDDGNDEEITSNAAWRNVKQLFEDAASKSENEQLLAKKQHWITDNTLKLVEERRTINQITTEAERQQHHLDILNRNIKAALKKDKNNFIKEICAEIEKHANRHETKDLFKKVRYLSRDFKPKSWAINDHLGKLQTELPDILKTWRIYCKDLFHANAPKHPYPTLNSENREPDILKSEIEKAITSLKNGKVPGNDGITAETIKAMGDVGVSIFHQICNKIWKSGEWPDDWTHSIFIPLHKKGPPQNTDNYRLIALITHASKILLHVLNERLKSYLTPQISEFQTGFVKGKGTREQILNIRQIIEKAREYNVPTFLCFLDYRKAFDSVKWQKLWVVLREMGVPQHLVQLVTNLYHGSTAQVRVDGFLTENFNVKSGVRQGCILSPILFNIYGEYIMRRAFENWEGGIAIGGRRINNLRYADDTTLIAGTADELELLIQRTETESQLLGLEINKSKTKILIIDRQNNNQAEVTAIANIEVVHSFVYLGALVTNTGDCEPEIKRRLGMGRGVMNKLQKIWKDGSITKNTKISLIHSLVFSVATYAAETWTIRERERKRIDAFEMWCYRRMLRISYTEHRTNVSILEELHIQRRLSDKINAHILQYFGHITRKEDIEHLIIEGKVEGRRQRGKPPKRWSDQVQKLTRITIVEAIRKAHDRDRWRNLIRAVTTPPPGDTD